MRLRFRPLLPFLLLTGATNSWSAAGEVTVSVESMIGVATQAETRADGQTDSFIIPSGQITVRDPVTGKLTLTAATIANRVNEVVQAIAAMAADASDRLPTDEGCSDGKDPKRTVAEPEYDEVIAAAIEQNVEVMTSGELMMVIAVLINNANHLCIDSSAVADAIALIARLRPEEASNLVFIASLLDPKNADRYANAIRTRTPAHLDNHRPPFQPERDIPPGGTIGAPPSPE